MSLHELHEAIIRMARSNPPSDRVPYAFEQRVLARLRGESVVDVLTLWTRALWRAAVPCTAVMLLLLAWTGSPPLEPSGEAAAPDLGAELETTLMASVSVDNDLSW